MKRKSVRAPKKERTFDRLVAVLAGLKAAPLAEELTTKGPLYVASAGLFAVYAWGYRETFPTVFAGGMIAVTFMSELLKPRLGELLADAKGRLEKSLMVGAVGACVGLGALGGTVALEAAGEPGRDYDAASVRAAAARAQWTATQDALNAVPACTPEMPRSRCETLTANNAALRIDRTTVRDEARREAVEAQAILDALPEPGPRLPHVEWQVKALIIGGIEFVVFAVPFVRARRSRQSVVQALAEKSSSPVQESKAEPAGRINDGGWETRRAKYGITGRRSRAL